NAVGQWTSDEFGVMYAYVVRPLRLPGTELYVLSRGIIVSRVVMATKSPTVDEDIVGLFDEPAHEHDRVVLHLPRSPSSSTRTDKRVRRRPTGSGSPTSSSRRPRHPRCRSRRKFPVRPTSKRQSRIRGVHQEQRCSKDRLSPDSIDEDDGIQPGVHFTLEEV